MISDPNAFLQLLQHANAELDELNDGLHGNADDDAADSQQDHDHTDVLAALAEALQGAFAGAAEQIDALDDGVAQAIGATTEARATLTDGDDDDHDELDEGWDAIETAVGELSGALAEYGDAVANAREGIDAGYASLREHGAELAADLERTIDAVGVALERGGEQVAAWSGQLDDEAATLLAEAMDDLHQMLDGSVDDAIDGGLDWIESEVGYTLDDLVLNVSEIAREWVDASLHSMRDLGARVAGEVTGRVKDALTDVLTDGVKRVLSELSLQTWLMGVTSTLSMAIAEAVPFLIVAKQIARLIKWARKLF